MAELVAKIALPWTSGSWRLAIVVACLLAAACTGFEPMDVPDERENPTFPGVFTGEDGEWVIYGK